jgi:hypothetical protein
MSPQAGYDAKRNERVLQSHMTNVLNKTYDDQTISQISVTEQPEYKDKLYEE